MDLLALLVYQAHLRPELRVVGRESAFKFQGSAEDLSKVGAQLGVSHVSRGGVRKAGGPRSSGCDTSSHK